jgi:hypothetical protein
MSDQGAFMDLSEERAREFDLDAEDEEPPQEPRPTPTCTFPGFAAPTPTDHSRLAPAGRPAPHHPVGSKQHEVDTLLAALKLSRVPAFADEALYRYLLEAWFTRYYDGRVLDLQLVWQSLVGSEGVNRHEAAMPLALLEAGQAEHGLVVRLPAEMLASECLAELRSGAVALLESAGGFRAAAERVMTPLERVAAGAIEVKARKARAAGAGKTHGAPAQSRGTPGPASFRKVFALAVLALASVSLALFQPLRLWDRTHSVDMKETSHLLELGAGLQHADLLVASVLDPRWNDWSPDQQRERVRELARLLAGRGVRRLNLTDAADGSLAFAHLDPEGNGGIQVRLASD